MIGGPRLSWNRRIRVALGAAKGLAYLHSDLDQPKVINVYFKPSNILIDSSYNAKLSYFRMAKVEPVCDHPVNVALNAMQLLNMLTQPSYFALKCLKNPRRRPNAQELVNALEQIQELQIESFQKFYN
ncbi:hypothetical protein L1987_63025 [Smallanthus sonchifolius]|uniref:Uncharacterized protein n=1 Tax=Smallanthus sonchifolius TaxID=185202 RepID=A0ACB9CC77_9ASTR|nr:hypothetical protein L1987_63025 [Smallanthus sonchifolius]